MTISSAVRALVSRMDQHPEEFINAGWDPVVSNLSNFLYGTRWETVSELMSINGTQIFTPEEVEAYMGKLKGVLHARAEESIIKELVGYAKKNSMEEADAYRQKQLNLPLGTSTVNANIKPSVLLTTTDITREALKIIGATYK